MKSGILAILSLIFVPILCVVVMGVLAGMWFDVEEWIERPEYAEAYMYQDWQCLVFYIVLAMISLLELLLIYFYSKNSKSRFRYIAVGIALFVWCIIILFFILDTNTKLIVA